MKGTPFRVSHVLSFDFFLCHTLVCAPPDSKRLWCSDAFKEDQVGKMIIIENVAQKWQHKNVGTVCVKLITLFSPYALQFSKWNFTPSRRSHRPDVGWGEHHVTFLFDSGLRSANGGHLGAESALKYCLLAQGSFCVLLKWQFWGAAKMHACR